MMIKGNTVGHPLPDPRRGLSMQGGIHMNGQVLTGLRTPAADSDAATKRYAESYARYIADSRHKSAVVTLPAAGWSDEAPYTQSIPVDWILETDTPHFGVIYSDALETALAEKDAFACVDDLDTEEGSITFTCFEERPEADLTVRLEVNRSGEAETAVALLSLEEGDDAAVQAEIEGVSYNMRNATVNSTPTAGVYDFTIL